jgi:hypothetical protein
MQSVVLAIVVSTSHCTCSISVGSATSPIQIAALATAVAAVLFSVGSAWWLYGHRGKLEATSPPRFGFLSDGTLFNIRIPLAIRNSGGRTLIVHDLRFWLPNTGQVLAIPWRYLAHSIHEGLGSPLEPPVPFAVRGHDAVAMIVEFGCPLPGFTMAKGRHVALVQVLAADRLKWVPLAKIVLVVGETLDGSTTAWGVHENLPVDSYTLSRAEKAALKSLAKPSD